MKLTLRISQEYHHAFGVWKNLKKNWIVSISEKFVFLLLSISIVLLLWQWKHLPPLVPLWYDKPWGAEQLADPHWLFILPLSSLVVYIVNVVSSIYIISDYLVFIQIASLTSLLVSFLSCITLMKIIFLVG